MFFLNVDFKAWLHLYHAQLIFERKISMDQMIIFYKMPIIHRSTLNVSRVVGMVTKAIYSQLIFKGN